MPNLYDPDDLAPGEATPEHPDDAGADALETPRRPWQQRKYQAAAAVGIAATAAIAIAVLAHQDPAKHDTALSGGETGSGAGNSAGQVGAAAGTSSAAAASAGASSAEPAAAPTAPVAPPVQAPAEQPPDDGAAPAPKPVTTLAVTDVAVKNSGSLPKDHHTLRVVTARGDLTGQRELGWVADDGHVVGHARCTQNFQVGNTPPKVRPTMLLCWRTSAGKSVVTVEVDLDKPPSEKTAVDALEAAWAKMG